jgi:hypothetical protein
MKRLAILVIPALLAGCGTLPQPFLGRPGPEASRLSVPPPPVLIIPPAQDALLGNAAAAHYAQDLATALVAQDVPSIARPSEKYDWQLIARARIKSDQVIPSFAIIGPTGRVYGHATMAPVPAESWANATPQTLEAVATAAAPILARQLGTINASVQQSNPKSLENRPTRMMIAGVKGAPGDGNHALALDVRRDLAQQGIVIVTNRHDADFILSGLVKVSPAPVKSGQSPSDIVELDWLVRSQSGAFIGKVSQLHDLKPDQMAPYWGDVAVAAAQQAALGIKQVVVNAIPKRVAAPHEATGAAASAKPGTRPGS